jgi:hypothetical protein
MHAALFLALLWVALARAQQDDATVWLASVGYASDTFSLVMAWQENANGDLVTGYHLRRRDGLTLDVYRFGDSLLTDADRLRMGIVAKNWALSAAERPTEHGNPALDAKRIPLPPEIALTPADLSRLPEFSFPASDAAKLMAEDMDRFQDGEKSPWRAGIHRELPLPMDGSFLQPLPSHATGPSAMSGAKLSIPGAVGLRLFIAVYEAVPATTLYLLSGDSSVIEKLDPAPEDGYWANTIYSDTVVILLVSAQPSKEPPRLSIPALIEMYRNPLEAAKTNPGPCNLDASCFPEWNTAGSGVAVLGTAGLGGALFCTGTLIADASDCIDLPLLLTANHCVGTQTKASTLEFYWDYANSQCNGPPPSITTVPKTGGGATLLATQLGNGFTGGGNDFTLLRMNNAPPQSAARLGWSAQPQPLATPVVSLHHPRLSYRRIALGQITGPGNLFPQYFHQVHWAQGTTEPGSSGCALLRADTGQIIGQLWGGNASCIFPNAADYYGRFDLTYPIIAPFLHPDPKAGFSLPAQSVSESVGTLDLAIQLSAPAPPTGLTISFERTAGSATPGGDFMPAAGMIQIAAGQSSGTLSLTLHDDTHAEADETLEITLTPGTPSCVEMDPERSRISITIVDDDADSDGDGLSDYDEINGVFGFVTDPFNRDTDGDGLTDYEELTSVYGYLLNPTERDTDGDGYQDYNELLLGTNPTIMDGNLLSTFSMPWFR